MALSWQTIKSLPRLTTYEDASKYEKSITPIKGDAYKTKPVGRRDMKFMSIKRDTDDSIVVARGSHELIRWYPNGDVRIKAETYWNKGSTNDMICAILPGSCETFDGRAWYTEGGKSTALTNEGVVFRHDEQGVLRPVGASEIVTHVLNQKALKEAMAPYERFLTTALGLARLRDFKTVEAEEWQQTFGFKSGVRDYYKLDPDWYGYRHLHVHHDAKKAREECLDQFLGYAASDEPAEQFKAFIILGASLHTHRFDYNQCRTIYEMRTRPEAWRKKFIHYLLLKHGTALLKKKVHTDGKPRKDGYRAYVLGEA